MTTVTVSHFFETDFGSAKLYTLVNDNKMSISITDFGAHTVSILVPDREGKIADVVLGYDTYAGYRSRTYYLGATVGRCCNRIAKGQFTLDGAHCQLNCNNGRNHLHGGIEGFDQKLWQAGIVQDNGDELLRMTLHSPDGDERYPGDLDVEVTFRLDSENRFVISYRAKSDRDTLCNLTNHSYFNLAGHDSGDMLSQQLRINAGFYTEADAEGIPTGRVLPVDDTPMDFRTFHPIGARIAEPYEALVRANGYDHNWILQKNAGELGFCAELYDAQSGRVMTCYTTSPCVQMYTGNGIDGKQTGKNGCRYRQHAGVALETQFAPDSVNHPDWASPVLKVGALFEHTTIYQFSIR